MADVFDAHSFDFYATADMNAMGWTVSASAAAVSYEIGLWGRNSTQGLRLARISTANANAIARAIRAFTTTQTPINGIAYRTDHLPPAGSKRLILQFVDGTDAQVEVYLLPNGTLQVQSDSNILGTTTFAVAINTYYYLEGQAKIDTATGTVDLFVDAGNFASVNILSLSAVNTQVTGNASADGFALCHKASDVTDVSHNDFDDYYHTDPSDAVYAAPIGNVYVIAFRPNASGVHGDLVPVNAPVDYQAVNEQLENGDTNYIETTIVGAESSFPTTKVAINADILAIGITHVSRVTVAGASAIAPEWVINEVDYEGDPDILTEAYAAYWQFYTTNPASGVKWLTTGFNAAQIGEKVTA